MATVFIPPQLRALTQGQAQVTAAGTSVRRVIEDLEQRFPGLQQRLCANDALLPSLAVAINGTVSSLGLLTKVPDNAEVHFLPALGGG